MTIIKISSIACVSCLIVNKEINKLKEKYDLDIKEYDYDFDDVPYDIGNVLPILIFVSKDGNELSRLIGEVSQDTIENEIKRLGE